MSARLLRDMVASRRAATDDEVENLRRAFGEAVLPRQVTGLVTRKYGIHVEDNEEWPRDTTPEEYLESLRAAVLDTRGGIFAEYSEEENDWTIYFVGRARRAWQGANSRGYIVVIFNADRSLWITGFQPERGFSYVDRRDGHWIRRPR